MRGKRALLGAWAGRQQAAEPERALPDLDDRAAVVDFVRNELAEQGIAAPDEQAISASLRGAATVDAVVHVQQELSGLGALAEPLMDPRVTDVVLNGDGSVWCDAGSGMTRYPCAPIAADAARSIAVRLAMACGQRLDDAQPCADGVLINLPPGVCAGAVRVHAVLAPPAAGAACVSLRALSKSFTTLDDLRKTGMMSAQMTSVLRGVVRGRRNVVISGGTGAGKTTLLAALMAEVGPDERTVVIEDTPELLIEHPHVVAMSTRRGNAEGAGEISMRYLVRQSLRMRPDRIVVGEIRGAEVADLLVALNTGHAGSAGTIHANSPHAVPGRLEALAAMGGMPLASLRRQAADGIDVLVHVAKTDGGRRVTHLATLDRRGEDLAIREVWNGRPKAGWQEFCHGLPGVGEAGAA
ncbi:TadA family conjugal transfer-associated ATPase [Corynebacterium falsenii]